MTAVPRSTCTIANPSINTEHWKLKPGIGVGQSPAIVSIGGTLQQCCTTPPLPPPPSDGITGLRFVGGVQAEQWVGVSGSVANNAGFWRLL